jgi:hypothetical protein
VGLIRNNVAHCKRCGYELEGRQHTCSRCQYSPRAQGLRVALTFLMAVVVLMSFMMVVPQYAVVLILLAGLSFALAFLALVVSFLATPSSRIGSMFLWMSNVR